MPSHTKRWRATVTASGGLLLAEPGRWAGFLSKLRGKSVYVTVAPIAETRNLNQNAYLWGIVYGALSEWSGHEPEELHEALKAKFLPEKDIEFVGSGQNVHLRSVPSTTGLTVAEFAAYVDAVKRFAAEMGCYIPEAGEVGGIE